MMVEHPDPRGRFEGQLRVEVSAVGDAVVVAVKGEIDIATVAQVREPLQDALAAEAQVAPNVVVLDMEGVTFICSAGLAMLAQCNEAATEAGGLRIVASGRPVPRLLHITGLDTQLQVFPSVQEALSAPQSS
jgi:anti-sigma B factor antagonist